MNTININNILNKIENYKAQTEETINNYELGEMPKFYEVK